MEFCRYPRSLYPAPIRIAIVLDNFSPHLTTKKDTRVGDWAAADNVEFACTPTDSSWLNRIEARFTALRYFAIDGTDHASHKEQTRRRLTPPRGKSTGRTLPETASGPCPGAWHGNHVLTAP
ncbi:hypothetical protein [Streptomyces rimosus]|uniref:hypothetical protein n=1 Tax=Streptomyces rimosus TaxID=1927 RepID=UPI0037D6C393